MSETEYVVLRGAPDLPAGFLPDELDGLWLDRARMQSAFGYALSPAGAPAVAVATGRFEMREDGAAAEVYEFRR